MSIKHAPRLREITGETSDLPRTLQLLKAFHLLLSKFPSSKLIAFRNSANLKEKLYNTILTACAPGPDAGAAINSLSQLACRLVCCILHDAACGTETAEREKMQKLENEVAYAVRKFVTSCKQEQRYRSWGQGRRQYLTSQLEKEACPALEKHTEARKKLQNDYDEQVKCIIRAMTDAHHPKELSVLGKLVCHADPHHFQDVIPHLLHCRTRASSNCSMSLGYPVWLPKVILEYAADVLQHGDQSQWLPNLAEWLSTSLMTPGDVAARGRSVNDVRIAHVSGDAVEGMRPVEFAGARQVEVGDQQLHPSASDALGPEIMEASSDNLGRCENAELMKAWSLALDDMSLRDVFVFLCTSPQTEPATGSFLDVSAKLHRVYCATKATSPMGMWSTEETIRRVLLMSVSYLYKSVLTASSMSSMIVVLALWCEVLAKEGRLRAEARHILSEFPQLFVAPLAQAACTNLKLHMLWVHSRTLVEIALRIDGLQQFAQLFAANILAINEKLPPQGDGIKTVGSEDYSAWKMLVRKAVDTVPDSWLAEPRVSKPQAKTHAHKTKEFNEMVKLNEKQKSFLEQMDRKERELQARKAEQEELQARKAGLQRMAGEAELQRKAEEMELQRKAEAIELQRKVEEEELQARKAEEAGDRTGELKELVPRDAELAEAQDGELVQAHAMPVDSNFDKGIEPPVLTSSVVSSVSHAEDCEDSLSEANSEYSIGGTAYGIYDPFPSTASGYDPFAIGRESKYAGAADKLATDGRITEAPERAVGMLEAGIESADTMCGAVSLASTNTGGVAPTSEGSQVGAADVASRNEEADVGGVAPTSEGSKVGAADVASRNEDADVGGVTSTSEGSKVGAADVASRNEEADVGGVASTSEGSKVGAADVASRNEEADVRGVALTSEGSKVGAADVASRNESTSEGSKLGAGVTSWNEEADVKGVPPTRDEADLRATLEGKTLVKLKAMCIARSIATNGCTNKDDLIKVLLTAA